MANTTCSVGEATRLYQAALEEHRARPDDEGLAAEMARAWSGLNLAWVEHVVQQPAAGATGGGPTP